MNEAAGGTQWHAFLSIIARVRNWMLNNTPTVLRHACHRVPKTAHRPLMRPLRALARPR